MDTNFHPVTKRGPRGKYRQHSQEFKRMVVELAMPPGASVARVARDHGVNANQVFTWRRQHAAGQQIAVPGLAQYRKRLEAAAADLEASSQPVRHHVRRALYERE